MNIRIAKQILVITLAMIAALTVGSSMAFGQGARPSVQGNTSLTLADGSVLHLISSFRADVDSDAAGNTIALNEATLEAEIALPPGPPSVPGAHPPGPCRYLAPGEQPPGPPCHYLIRGETSTSTAKPSLMIALLLLQHGYVTQNQITQTLGFTVTVTRSTGDSSTTRLASDAAVFGLLFAQVNAVDPSSSAAVAQLLNQSGIHLFPPGPPSVPGPQ